MFLSGVTSVSCFSPLMVVLVGVTVVSHDMNGTSLGLVSGKGSLSLIDFLGDLVNSLEVKVLATDILSS